MEKIFTGVVVDNPLLKLGVNTDLKVTTQRFGLEGFPRPYGTTSPSSFNGTALSVSFRNTEGHHTLGSAAVVGPGIAISAKHVIEEWLNQLVSGGAAAVCQGITQHGVDIWEVVKTTTVDSTDIAILILNRRSAVPENRELNTCHISTRTPVVGDRVLLTGFTATNRTAEIRKNTELSGLMRVSHGEVIDVFPSGRDRVMLPGPSFAIDCPAFGGMSGGGVFDRDGYLIGLVSSSTDGDPIAYASHIWPALVGTINPEWPYSITSTSLLNMGRKHGVHIHRPDAFKPSIRNGKVAWSYVLWS